MDTHDALNGRRAIISYYTNGQRGLDGLTDRERALLLELRQLGYEIARMGRFQRCIRRARPEADAVPC